MRVQQVGHGRGVVFRTVGGPGGSTPRVRAESACCAGMLAKASRDGQIAWSAGCSDPSPMKASLILVVAAACGSVNDSGAPDAAVADAPVDAAPALYQPPVLPVQMMEVTVTDPARVGGARTLNVALRFSRDAALPAPIAVWSHGGATGQTNAATALDKWAIAAAEAGYFSVAIAHTPRTPAQRTALCTELGIDAGGCDEFKFLSYDRPLDIAVVLDRLVELAATPQFAGKLDVTRIAVGGHSAGAGGALMVDGAPRVMGSKSVRLADARPLAFLALSPQAPGSDGMTAPGYAQIVRPTLIGTGRGDDNPPDTAEGRASVFDAMQPGHKARVFIEDPAAIHTVFALETEACSMRAPLAHCEEMVAWVRSAGIAFLDAEVRGLPEAIAWLASPNLTVASEGVALWSTR